MVVTLNPFTFTFLGGKLVQSVTSITLVNNTAKTQDVTVPAGKRWFLLGIKVVNPDDVNRDTTVDIYKEAAKTNLLCNLIGQWPLNTLVTMYYPFSNTASTSMTPEWHPIFLEAANTISVTWAAGGASTGATDADGLVICYLEIDV